MDRLILSFLGGFRARLESGSSVIVPTKRGRALLAYLACSPTESHSRDKLATLFWGDSPQPHSRHNLRQTLLVLRSALDPVTPSILRSDSACVSLDRARLVVDAVDFEQLAAEGSPQSLEQAGALYQGDFLAGIDAGDQAFEEWLRDERERLYELAVEVYAKLLTFQREAGLTESAVRSAGRLLALDPAQEIVHRTLMRLYVILGRPRAALRQYERCARTLRELGTEPEEKTKELLRAISSARLAEAEIPAPALPLAPSRQLRSLDVQASRVSAAPISSSRSNRT